MQLIINEEVHRNVKAKTLAELVGEFALQTAGTAIAVNQRVIARKDWQTYQLQENDEVFIIRATHGG